MQPPRSLKLRLAELLDEKHPNTKIAAHAEALGISDTTLRKYLRNEALTLDRRVIEKACDYLDVGIADLFELVVCDFFPHGEQPLKLLRSKRSGLDDFGTIGDLTRFFVRNGVQIEEEVCDRPSEIVDLVSSKNCIVVGSPRTNIAGEVAICSLFQADVSDLSKQNRQKLPFLMQVPPGWHEGTALIQVLSRQGEKLTQCQLMAVESAENTGKTHHAFADYYPHETFAQTHVDHGRDFGVIFVAEQQTTPPVRTYWISGFSSVGTQASTQVLTADFRSFSVGPGEFVLGIIQATYSKKANSAERKLIQEPKVVHTVRGRLPVRKDIARPVRRSNDLPLVSEEVEPNHSARQQKFRVIVKKTWRSQIPAQQMPTLVDFYDRELRQLGEESFAGMLHRLEESYASISPDRLPQSLERYLRTVVEARDGGYGDLFKGQ